MFSRLALIVALFAAGCVSQAPSAPVPPSGSIPPPVEGNVEVLPAPENVQGNVEVIPAPENHRPQRPRPPPSQPQAPSASPQIIPAPNGPSPAISGQPQAAPSQPASPASPFIIPAVNGPSVAVAGAPSPANPINIPAVNGPSVAVSGNSPTHTFPTGEVNLVNPLPLIAPPGSEPNLPFLSGQAPFGSHFPSGPVNVPAVNGPSVAVSGPQPAGPTNPAYPLPLIATPGSEPQLPPGVHFPGSGFSQGSNPFMNHQAQPFMPFGPSNIMPPFFGAAGPHIPPPQDGPGHSQPDDEDEENASGEISERPFPGRLGLAKPGPGQQRGRPGSRITFGIIKRILEGAPVDVKIVDSNKIKIKQQKGHHGRKHRRFSDKGKGGKGNQSGEKGPSGLEAHHPFAAKRSRFDI